MSTLNLDIASCFDCGIPVNLTDGEHLYKVGDRYLCEGCENAAAPHVHAYTDKCFACNDAPNTLCSVPGCLACVNCGEFEGHAL